MPVIIENHSPRDLPDDQPHRYRLRINSTHVAWFEHRRDEGLAACLRRAAEAVDQAESAGRFKPPLGPTIQPNLEPSHEYPMGRCGEGR